MERLHLFEFADQSWFPRTWADAGTAYLQVLQDKLGAETFFIPLVEQAMQGQSEQPRRIIDLCSGGGGPSIAIQQAMSKKDNGGGDHMVHLTLSDLHPNEARMNKMAQDPIPGVTVHPHPVDATNVPKNLKGLRTVFNAMHHMQPPVAKALLKDAQQARQPILVAELSERTILNFLMSGFISLFVLLVMPLVRPVKMSWLLFTYIVPILPMTIAWDGMVSHLRTYSVEELKALTQDLEEDGWIWKMGQVQAGNTPAKVTWLIGRPVQASSSR